MAGKTAKITFWLNNNMVATRVVVQHLSRKNNIPAGWKKGSQDHPDPKDGSKGGWLVHLNPHKLEHLVVPVLQNPMQQPGKNNPYVVSFNLGAAASADKTFFRVIALDATGVPVVSLTVPTNFKGTFG